MVALYRRANRAVRALLAATLLLAAFLLVVPSIECLSHPSFQEVTISCINQASTARISTRLHGIRKRRTRRICLRPRLFALEINEEDMSFEAQLLDPFEKDIQIMTTGVAELARIRNYRKAYKLLRRVARNVKEHRQQPMSEKACRAVDDSFRIFTETVFAPEQSVPVRFLLLGSDAINLQLSLSGLMPEKYDNVPRTTFVRALKALTRWNEANMGDSSYTIGRNADDGPQLSPSELSFRILQRLITGIGVRKRTHHAMIQEQDINMVLNTFSNSGRMDLCHRIIALQQRTNNTPPISPASYSILLKGYGKLGDLVQVEQVLKNAILDPNMRPDTIFMNSLINAFVNCNAMGRANEAFEQMKAQRNSNEPVTRWFPEMPPPNKRTYNTILKGLGRSNATEKALELSKEMRARGMWDGISLNTLVQAALSSSDFELAEELLDQYAWSPHSSTMMTTATRDEQRHPNTEAYTELLDRFAKAGRLADALRVFQLMKERGVAPNKITYTCLISGLARHGKVGEAQRMLGFMNSTLIPPSVVVYNALISAILAPPITSVSIIGEASAAPDANAPQDMDEAIVQALKVLRTMIQSGIPPNSITVVTIIDAMGKCSPPRVTGAILLVRTLQKQNILSMSDAMANTALVRICGLNGDIKNAISAFRNITHPDLIAINAFLDVCCKCGRVLPALETFRYFFGEDDNASLPSRGLKPDVISYTILISSLLKSTKAQTRKTARKLYHSMKRSRMIYPDTALIDSILKEMLSVSRFVQLSRDEIGFIATVIRDAERLEWGEGFLDRRKRAVRTVLSDRIEELRRKYAFVDKVLDDDKDDDELFRRKGWNQIDSGFRLWGNVDSGQSRSSKKEDDFLKSKGWNNVDSGFRII